MKEYFKELDILRGIAIVMVILGHAIILFPINLHEISWCQYLFVVVSSVHMSIFFLVAGACYSYHYGRYGSYILKKVKRLIVPWMFFVTFSVVMKNLFPELINGEPESLKEIVVRGELVFVCSLYHFCNISFFREDYKEKHSDICCLYRFAFST